MKKLNYLFFFLLLLIGLSANNVLALDLDELEAPRTFKVQLDRTDEATVIPDTHKEIDVIHSVCEKQNKENSKINTSDCVSKKEAELKTTSKRGLASNGFADPLVQEIQKQTNELEQKRRNAPGFNCKLPELAGNTLEPDSRCQTESSN